MSEKWHDYDYLGHQPGCGVCAEEREERTKKLREALEERRRVDQDFRVFITYAVEDKNGKEVDKKIRVKSYHSGTQFDPNIYAASALEDAFDILDTMNDIWGK